MPFPKCWSDSHWTNKCPKKQPRSKDARSSSQEKNQWAKKNEQSTTADKGLTPDNIEPPSETEDDGFKIVDCRYPPRLWWEKTHQRAHRGNGWRRAEHRTLSPKQQKQEMSVGKKQGLLLFRMTAWTLRLGQQTFHTPGLSKFQEPIPYSSTQMNSRETQTLPIVPKISTWISSCDNLQHQLGLQPKNVCRTFFFFIV